MFNKNNDRLDVIKIVQHIKGDLIRLEFRQDIWLLELKLSLRLSDRWMQWIVCSDEITDKAMNFMEFLAEETINGIIIMISSTY